MRSISRWANQHRQLAILLLIGCEGTAAFSGLLLGANALAHWSGGMLLLSTLALLGFGCWIRWWMTNHPPSTYAASRWQLAGAFGSTYLLFVLLGGQWGLPVTQPPADRTTDYRAGLRSTAFGGHRVERRADTLIVPGKPTPVLSGTQAAPAPAPVDQAGKRFAFILLFLLGVVLMFFCAGLACGLACSNQGFLAVLVLLLGLGAGVGGIFFAARSIDRPINRWQDMPMADRKRTMRRFGRGVLVLFGILLLLVIL